MLLKQCQNLIKSGAWRRCISTLKIEDRDRARWITLNDPKRKNVLSYEVLTELRRGLEIDNSVHCVVISAEGNVFCAGHDLKELTSERRDAHQKLFDLCSEVMLSIKKLPVPVLAKVRGHAAAAGCQLVASCDIVIASHSAKFSVPGVNLGLFCSTPGVALVRAVPRKVAAYMLHTGLPISAQEAAQYGLVSRLVSDEQLDAETVKVVGSICEKSRPVQTLGKEFFNQQLTLSSPAAYSEGSKVMVENLKFKEAQNGISAFINKQVPKFEHSSEKIPD